MFYSLFPYFGMKYSITSPLFILFPREFAQDSDDWLHDHYNCYSIPKTNWVS